MRPLRRCVHQIMRSPETTTATDPCDRTCWQDTCPPIDHGVIQARAWVKERAGTSAGDDTGHARAHRRTCSRLCGKDKPYRKYSGSCNRIFRAVSVVTSLVPLVSNVNLENSSLFCHIGMSDTTAIIGLPWEMWHSAPTMSHLQDHCYFTLLKRGRFFSLNDMVIILVT